ncbi:hypothetical protein V8C42DRAFT_243099 [Trichoderma barbatum]
MGRRKIEIKLLDSQKARSATFGKRKHGLFKKAYELGALTGCSVSVFIEDENGDPMYAYLPNATRLGQDYRKIPAKNIIGPSTFRLTEKDTASLKKRSRSLAPEKLAQAQTELEMPSLAEPVKSSDPDPSAVGLSLGLSSPLEFYNSQDLVPYAYRYGELSLPQAFNHDFTTGAFEAETSSAYGLALGDAQSNVALLSDFQLGSQGFSYPALGFGEMPMDNVLSTTAATSSGWMANWDNIPVQRDISEVMDTYI